MKHVASYIVFAVFLTFFSYVYKPFISTANRQIIKSIVFVSYPVTGLLGFVREFSDRYVLLLDAKRENSALKRKIVQLELKSKMIGSGDFTKPEIAGAHNIFKAKFEFKNNFNIDYIFLYVDGNLDLSKNSCSVFSNKMNLVGIIDKKDKDSYITKTVFNHSFVADSFIVSGNSTYRALFIGDLYRPQAEFLTPNARIKKGAVIYSSGEFGVFPKGFVIGRVSGITDVHNYYKVAYISIDKSFFNDWNLFVICIKKH